MVRAAAVTALAKFGVASKDGGNVDPEVKKSVVVLLTRCLDDPDDEVRDRAALNLKLIQEEEGEVAERFIKNESTFSLPIFEHQLVMYVTGDQSTFDKPFDLSSIPIVTRAEADAEDRSLKLRSTTMPTLKAPTTPGISRPSAAPSAAEAATSSAAAAQQYAQQLATVPELKPYGSVLKSTREVELTEVETEYVVTAIKHIFKKHIVLQFNVKNTLTDTILEDVSMITTPSDPESEDEDVGLEEDFIIPALKLANEEKGTIYVAFKRTREESNYATTTFTNVLKFTSKEIDPSTGEPEAQGFEDEYQVEDLELAGGDYIIPAFIGSFGNVWEQVGAAGPEVTETFSLGTGVKSIQGLCFPLNYPLAMNEIDTYRRNRGLRGALAVAFSSTLRGLRCGCQHGNTQPQIIWKDDIWWASGGASQDGL